ncbi:MAG: hypothetical protein RL569_838 [Actinomycetota bacterium]
MFLGETKKESKSMTQSSTRKGLAWGAAVALVGSLFGVMPAQADANISLTPIKGTSTSTFVTEEFTLVAATLNSSADSSVGKLTYLVEKLSSVGVVAYSADSTTSADIAAGSSGKTIAAASTSVAVIPTSSAAVAGKKNIFSLKLVDATTSSASVDVKVTAFIDNDLDGVLDSGESNEAVTVSFLKYSAVTAAVALTQPIVGDVKSYATGSVSGINTDQLSGDLQIAFTHTSASATVSYSAIAAGSASAAVPALLVDETISAQVRYTHGSFNGLLGTADTKLVKAAVITAATWSPVKGDNAKASGSGSVSARINSAFVLNVKTVTNSTAVASIPATVTMNTYAAADALGSTRYILVNGTKITSSADVSALELKLTTGTDGVAAVNVETVGFATDGTTFSFTVKAQNLTNTYEVILKKPVFTVGNAVEAQLINLGASATLNYTVKDQWGVSSKRTNQRLKFTVTNPTGMAAKLDPAAVTAGAASAVLAATPVTVSGTVQVYAELQEADQDTGVFAAVGTATNVTVSVVVSSKSATFTTKPVATFSASISYGAAMSWSAVAANAIVVSAGGASVEVSSPNVVFFYDDATFSGKVTMPTDASGNVPAFKMASGKAGKHTISFTVGATTSTAVLTVEAAAADAGKTISFDKTALVSGETAKITGTLVDANGNPVLTSGSADVVVSWTGLGLPFGTGTLETDADGKFSINVLVLSTEVGASTLTATYRPTGDAASTKNITVAQAITIGTAAAEVNAVIGSFNGRWAVRVENAKGSAVVYKVGGKWYKATASSDNFVFSRKSRKGASVLVKVWVNGDLQNEQTITVK